MYKITSTEDIPNKDKIVKVNLELDIPNFHKTVVLNKDFLDLNAESRFHFFGKGITVDTDLFPFLKVKGKKSHLIEPIRYGDIISEGIILKHQPIKETLYKNVTPDGKHYVNNIRGIIINLVKDGDKISRKGKLINYYGFDKYINDVNEIMSKINIPDVNIKGYSIYRDYRKIIT